MCTRATDVNNQHDGGSRDHDALCCAGSGQDVDGPAAAPDPFQVSSQVGLVGTLHHVSAIRDSDARRPVIGLTYRLGRHIPGAPVVWSFRLTFSLIAYSAAKLETV